MYLIFLTFFIILQIFTFTKTIYANSSNTNCSNRYATLVNPVRSRKLWVNNTLDPISNQYNAIKVRDLPATWLLQYDAIEDEQLASYIKNFDQKQEKGVFLEVSKYLADKSRVIYPYDVDYFNPRAIFLSSYNQKDRKRLIDQLFSDFRKVFGYYPKSVGAWWIDSYSLNYMREKYKINSALIVADQKTTDKYGLWGQWWGVPYYPSKANILTPASSIKNKEDVVVIQWAQRDPLLSFGDGPDYSRYSLQANDYTIQGKDTNYFIDLVNTYLDCQNKIGQITIGLETGMESVAFASEYNKQLEALEKIPDLNYLTMSQFSDRFSIIYPEYPNIAQINGGGSQWLMSTSSRKNDKLKDFTSYNPQVAFKDYFLADKSEFLDRKLSIISNMSEKSYFPYWLIPIFLYGFFYFKSDKKSKSIFTILFTLALFGLSLKSHYRFGWMIFYSGYIPFLAWAQIGLVIYSLSLIELITKLGLFKKLSNSLWLLPLSFSVDPVIQSMRYTLVSGRSYLGFATDNLGFIGISYSKITDILFIKRDFPAYQAAALLRINFYKIWDNPLLYLIVYPAVHIFIALILSFVIYKLPQKIRTLLVFTLVLLFVWHIFNLIYAEPVVVTK